jgi:hypothetical protein
VSRVSAHAWLRRYLTEGVVADRSNRPRSYPNQADADAELLVVGELRRAHPRWGAKRIRLEMVGQGGVFAAGFGGDFERVPSFIVAGDAEP